MVNACLLLCQWADLLRHLPQGEIGLVSSFCLLQEAELGLSEGQALYSRFEEGGGGEGGEGEEGHAAAVGTDKDDGECRDE